MAGTPTIPDLAPSADPGPAGTDMDDDAEAGADCGPGSVLPGLALVAGCVAAALGLHLLVPAVSALVAAVAIGAALTNLNLLPAAAQAGCHFASKRLLRAGIVLLGFRLAVGDALALGGPALAIVVGVVAATFFGTRWLGRLLGLSPDLSLLVATGFSICGASAIAAVESTTEASEEEVAYSIALVTLCGSLAIVVLPVAAPLLGLDGERFGTWAGASVHDVAQVVATASTAGTAALSAAVVVKLTRVLLLAPLVAGISLRRRRSRRPGRRDPRPAAARPPVMPLFVLGFLAAVAARSAELVPAGWLGGIRTVETLLLAAALVGLGTGVRVAELRRIGGRPLALALASWLLVAGVAYVGVVVVS